MAFELRPYQDQLSDAGLASLEKHGIAYYAMEVRVGKSLCALATAEKYADSQGIADRWVLVITKKKAIPSIQADYDLMKPSFQLYIINFESIHKIPENLRNRFFMAVIDEADCLGQYPKPATRVETIKKLVWHLPLLLMSGTPNPESMAQLYHQFYISKYSPWIEHKSFYAWARAGYVMVKKEFINNKEFNNYDDANEEAITADTRHLFITYSQEQAGFLQTVKEEVHFVQMAPATYQLAEIIIRDQVFVSKNGNAIVADTAVKIQQKVHQIYSGTCRLEPKRVKLPDGTFTIAPAENVILDRSKVQYIQQRFSGLKLAIFYKFDAEGDMLKNAFAGSWTDSPEAFNAGGKDLHFICQISSGKQGVNLSTADLQVMFNPDFSANSYWQGRARMITKDREKPVVVAWLMAVGGIEEKIYKAVMDKKDYTLEYFKRDFMPKSRKKHEVLLTSKQQSRELARAEAKVTSELFHVEPPPAVLDHNNFTPVASWRQEPEPYISEAPDPFK